MVCEHARMLNFSFFLITNSYQVSLLDYNAMRLADPGRLVAGKKTIFYGNDIIVSRMDQIGRRRFGTYIPIGTV
jgi:hypothetical protein